MASYNSYSCRAGAVTLKGTNILGFWVLWVTSIFERTCILGVTFDEGGYIQKDFLQIYWWTV